MRDLWSENYWAYIRTHPHCSSAEADREATRLTEWQTGIPDFRRNRPSYTLSDGRDISNR